MSGLEIFTLEDTPENAEQLASVLQMGLKCALDSETISPENWSAVWAWVRATRAPTPTRQTNAEPTSPLAGYTYSPHYQFWITLKKDQVVRWTGTKHATYEVVTGEITADPPTKSEERYSTAGAWVELRRHTGKTFWASLGMVRPAV